MFLCNALQTTDLCVLSVIFFLVICIFYLVGATFFVIEVLVKNKILVSLQ